MNALKKINFAKDLESKYYNKIIRDKSTKMISCKFYNKEEIEIFKKEHNIKFKRFNLDTLEGIEYENKRISSVLNLRERLIDTELSKEYCDKLGIKNLKVLIINSSLFRQGISVHISDGHNEIGNDINIINFINESFISPVELEIYKDLSHSDRFVFITKYDDNHKILNFMDLKGSKMEFVTSMYLNNKKCNKLIAKNLIQYK